MGNTLALKWLKSDLCLCIFVVLFDKALLKYVGLLGKQGNA